MARRKGLKGVEATEHKIAKTARKVDSGIAAAEVLTSGDGRRIARWLTRKVEGTIAQKLINKSVGLVGKVGKKRSK